MNLDVGILNLCLGEYSPLWRSPRHSGLLSYGNVTRGCLYIFYEGLVYVELNMSTGFIVWWFQGCNL